VGRLRPVDWSAHGERVSLHNILLAEFACPRCDYDGVHEVEFKFGWLDQITYRLGDEVRWAGGHGGKTLRRPPAGDLDGEGYAECPRCAKDFWVDIDIRGDRVVAAVPDSDRAGYIT
jgi:hypothetical protein